MKRAILIAGSGGQGILFMGDLICYSAMLLGKEVTSFPSYGVEKIGGYAKCTVIISDETIGSPIPEHIDILIAMNNWAIDKFSDKVIEGGLLFYDETIVNSDISLNCIIVKIPASEIALNEGASKGANMVMLGAFASKTSLIDMKTLYKVLKMRTPAHRRDYLGINKKLLQRGYYYCED